MTLVGLLPPLCDNGSMLVDGGYSKRLRLCLTSSLTRLRSAVDNLPVSNGESVCKFRMPAKDADC